MISHALQISLRRLSLWIFLYLLVLYHANEAGFTINEQFASYGTGILLISSVFFGLICVLASMLGIFAIYGMELLFNFQLGFLYQAIFHVIMLFFTFKPILYEYILPE